MSRRPLVPGAKEELDRIKTEFTNEFGMKYNDEYKGNKSSKLNGAAGGPVGGNMTKMMVEAFERKLVDK